MGAVRSSQGRSGAPVGVVPLEAEIKATLDRTATWEDSVISQYGRINAVER